LTKPAQTILVVDDSEEVREFFTIVLGDAGYHVEVAPDGEEGLARAMAIRPDAVVLDVLMPRMDGLEMLLKLRSNMAPPVPPVVLCSGFDLTEEEALRRGASRFLPKPIAPDDLLGAVAHAVEGLRPEPEEIATARRHSTAARLSAREAAEALVARMQASSAAGRSALRPFADREIRVFADYLGFAAGLVAVVRRDDLEVVGATPSSTFAPGANLGEHFSAGWEVVETGSSLVLPNASSHPSFSPAVSELSGVRSFLGVPLKAPTGIPVGLICLYDFRLRSIDPEDLEILQMFASRGTWLLGLVADGRFETGLPAHFGQGVLMRAVFEALLDCELRLLQRRGGSLALALVDQASVEAVRQTLAHAPVKERLMAGTLTGGRIALYQRVADGSAPAQLFAQLVELRARSGLSAIGTVELEDNGLRPFSGRLLLSLGELALDNAQTHHCGVRRLVIREEMSPLPGTP
jgi:CheY-like chemotaxis protein